MPRARSSLAIFSPKLRSTTGHESHLTKVEGIRNGSTGDAGLTWKNSPNPPLDKQSAATAPRVEHLATFAMKTEQFRCLPKSKIALTTVDDNGSFEL